MTVFISNYRGAQGLDTYSAYPHLWKQCVTTAIHFSMAGCAFEIAKVHYFRVQGTS